MFEFAKLRWGQSQLREYFLWALMPVLALLLYQIIFRSRRQRQRRGWDRVPAHPAWPGLDSEFYQIERKLARRGAVRQPAEPLSLWIQRTAADPALSPIRDSLHESLRLHYRYRFDPDGLSETERQSLRRETAGCLAKLL